MSRKSRLPFFKPFSYTRALVFPSASAEIITRSISRAKCPTPPSLTCLLCRPRAGIFQSSQRGRELFARGRLPTLLSRVHATRVSPRWISSLHLYIFHLAFRVKYFNFVPPSALRLITLLFGFREFYGGESDEGNARVF